MVYEWVESFKSVRTRVTDEDRSGRPLTSRTQDHKSNRNASSKNLIERYNKCIALQGDYVEK